MMAAIAIALVVSGCASTQRLSDSDRVALKSAKINETVSKGNLFLLAPSGANIGLMFGAVGGLAASGSIDDSQQAFGSYLDKNAISIEKIVREEVESALRASGKLAISSGDAAGAAIVNVSVPQYGFGVTHLLSSSVVPVMQIKCDIVDASGKLLWSANERMLPSIASPMESTTWTTLHDDPKQIEQRWRLAAKHLATNIIKEL
ncbi:MAG: hypothetical protein V4462_07685 [Pseudomonadota bacterium]